MPDIDEEAFRLEIGGLVNKPVELTLKDLKDPEKFPSVLKLCRLRLQGLMLITLGRQK